jgi:hypothetical protein
LAELLGCGVEPGVGGAQRRLLIGEQATGQDPRQ